MKKKITAILALGCIGLACVGAGCSMSELEKYQEQGYTVMVTYDANGGWFLGRDGITVMDLFNPSKYEADPDGTVHIKLKEPTDLSRPTSGTGNVTLTKQEHFFAGWYQSRELLKNEDGEVVDEYGVVLELNEEGKYVYPLEVGEEKPKEGMPAYTYAERWDFETDTIDYQEEDGLFEMTLYAAWIPYYQFDYYYRVEGETEWKYYDTTTFDYKTTKAENSPTHDKDTIWVPDWQNGAMNHSYRYANNEEFSFPKISGTTFIAAYLDADCTQKIDGSLEHAGTLDYEIGRAVNRVQNVYVEVEKGERFKISTAQQFLDYASLSGYYELYSDIDFENGNVKWPASFMAGEFTGKIYGANGEAHTIKNVVASYSSSSAKQGGLFGKIGKTASIKGITFENVTTDLASVATRTSDTTFGLFAGYIEEEAEIENVTVGGTLRLGAVELALAPDYMIHLLANGTLDGITAKPIKVVVYGMKRVNDYQYSFSPDNVTVDQTDWTITLDYTKSSKDNRREEESKEIGIYQI